MKQRTRPTHNGDEFFNNSMNNFKSSDGDSANDVQLHKIRQQEHFIEAQVQEGDTLQAIALRFHCSISELKRINHIHKDNEIFARRTVKVPVTPYSVLTELIPMQDSEPTPSTSNSTVSNATYQTSLPIQNHTHNNGVTQNLTQNKDMDGSSSDYAIDCNAVVLNSTLTPSVIPYTDKVPEENITEDTQLLPNKEKLPVEAVVVTELTSHGADFGLKWFHLLCCVLFLGVVIPLVYVMFYLDKHEHQDIPPLHTL